MAKTKGQARQTRLLALACGTPPTTRDGRFSDGFSDGFSDRFSDRFNDRFSDRFNDRLNTSPLQSSGGFKVVKLKLAQPLEEQGSIRCLSLGIPPSGNEATAATARVLCDTLDAAWPVCDDWGSTAHAPWPAQRTHPHRGSCVVAGYTLVRCGRWDSGHLRRPAVRQKAGPPWAATARVEC